MLGESQNIEKLLKMPSKGFAAEGTLSTMCLMRLGWCTFRPPILIPPTRQFRRKKRTKVPNKAEQEQGFLWIQTNIACVADLCVDDLA